MTSVYVYYKRMQIAGKDIYGNIRQTMTSVNQQKQAYAPNFEKLNSFKELKVPVT